MTSISPIKDPVRELNAETLALYFAARHPKTPWYAKLLVGGIVAYALSPIDLIPDFVPILGYVDDLLLLPVGIALALKLNQWETPTFKEWGEKTAWRLFNATTFALNGKIAEDSTTTRQLHQIIDAVSERV